MKRATSSADLDWPPRTPVLAYGEKQGVRRDDDIGLPDQRDMEIPIFINSNIEATAFLVDFEGKEKGIVIGDDIVEALTDRELEAVIQHERAHYECSEFKDEVPFSSTVLAPLCLGVLIGVREGVTSGVVATIGAAVAAALGTSYVSRVDEYRADAFAAEQLGSGEPLASALLKIDEMGTPVPRPPLYNIISSHPPIPERVSRLRERNFDTE